MKFNLLKIFKSDFILNTAKLLSGAASGQVFILIFTPLLTAIYLPADFGSLTTFIAASTLLSVIICARLDYAIPASKSPEEALVLCRQAIIFGTIASLLLILLTSYLIPDSVTRKYSLFLVIFNALLISSSQAFSFILLRFEMIARLSYLKLFQIISTVILQIFIGKYINSPQGLEYGLLLGQLLLLASLIFSSLKLFPRLNTKDYKLALKYLPFSVVSMATGMINNISVYIPAIFFAATGNLEFAGAYGLAQRIIGAPLDLLSTSLGQSFISALGKKNSNSSHNNLLIASTRPLLYLSTVLIALSLFSPSLFAIIFGPAWSDAGEVSRFMLIMYAFKVFGLPASQILAFSDGVKRLLFIDLLRLCAIFTAFNLIVPNNLNIIAVYCSIMSISYASYFITAMRLPELPSNDRKSEDRL